MASSNDDNDSRHSLYEEFEQRIVNAGSPDAYFDEDDLVEIFDYASDMDNYIVKMEVLMYGARHYPGSEALTTRRAWFYSSLGEMEAAAQVNDRVSSRSTLNNLLSLRAAGHGDTPATRRALDSMVDEADELCDEDVIQLVDFCADNDMLDWVAAARDRVAAKCSYMPTYLYEWAGRAEDADDLDTAQALYEELTMIEPFTADFWGRLAKVQLTQGHFDDALASADYALAIDAADIEALRIRARALYCTPGRTGQAIEVLLGILGNPSSDVSDVTAYAMALMETGRPGQAADILVKTLDSVPSLQMALDQLMQIDFDKATPYIGRMVADQHLDDDALRSWVRQHALGGEKEVAARLLELFAPRLTQPSDIEMMADIWFSTQRYGRIVQLVDTASAGDVNRYLCNPVIEIPYIMSLLGTGNKERALQAARMAVKTLEDDRQIEWDGASHPESLPADTSGTVAACIKLGYLLMLQQIISVNS